MSTSTTLRPDDPAVVIGFLLAATAVTVAAGSAGAALGAESVDIQTAVNGPSGDLLRAWMRLALVLAVVAPAGVLARWGRDPAVRRALLPYLAVLLVQIGTEATLPRPLPSWTVLLTGVLYTSFRIWQLRAAHVEFVAGRPDSAGRTAARLVIAAGRVFWTANLGVIAAHAPAFLPAAATASPGRP